MPRRAREPIQVRLVPVPASDAERNRVFSAVRRVLAAASTGKEEVEGTSDAAEWVTVGTDGPTWHEEGELGHPKEGVTGPATADG